MCEARLTATVACGSGEVSYASIRGWYWTGHFCCGGRLQ